VCLYNCCISCKTDLFSSDLYVQYLGGLFSIDLSNNELTGLPANAFRSVLNRMAQRGEQSFDISGSKILITGVRLFTLSV
jgi:hypothetical protein